jgi:predicted  nucleic acid-binding Zn-ribbon protein
MNTKSVENAKREQIARLEAEIQRLETRLSDKREQLERAEEELWDLGIKHDGR